MRVAGRRCAAPCSSFVDGRRQGRPALEAERRLGGSAPCKPRLYKTCVRDPRVDRLAELLVGYSLELRAGEIVCIDADTCAAPIVLAFYREALAAGAFPYTSVAIPDLDELLLEHGSNDQLEYISPMRWNEIESMDAMLTIWADENTRALNGVDPERHGLFIAANRKIAERRWKRIAAGEMRWCGVLYPTQAHAQDADMSLEDYEEFVFRACAWVG